MTALLRGLPCASNPTKHRRRQTVPGPVGYRAHDDERHAIGVGDLRYPVAFLIDTDCAAVALQGRLGRGGRDDRRAPGHIRDPRMRQ